MIKFYKPSNGEPWEGYGLSTDPKPTDETIPNGTALYTFDDQQLLVFDKDNNEWKVQ